MVFFELLLLMVQNQLSHGLGNAIFFLGFLAVGFACGAIPKSNITKLVSAGIIGFIFSAILEKTFNGYSPIATSMVAWTLFGVPFLAGWLLSKPMRRAAEKQVLQEMQKLTSIQMLEKVDKNLTSVIGSNHEWLKANWHKLEDAAKLKWVEDNRSRLNAEMGKLSDTVEMIDLMQKINREKLATTAEQKAV